jgi:oxygen-dependent protoporphyrinogen oxidase
VQGRRITGVSYLSQKWEGRVPDPDLTLLRVFVGGRGGQDSIASGHERLIEIVEEELHSMLGIGARPFRVWARVWDSGLHQYELGHLERVAEAESAVREVGALALAGAALHGIGLNECIDSGTRAAASILDALPLAALPRIGDFD